MLKWAGIGLVALLAVAGCGGAKAAAPPTGPSAAQVAWVGQLCTVNATYHQILTDFHTLPDNVEDPTLEAKAFLTATNRMTALAAQIQRLDPAPIAHGGDVVATYLKTANSVNADRFSQFSNVATNFLNNPTADQANNIDAYYTIAGVQVLSDFQHNKANLGGPDLATDPSFAAEYKLAKPCHAK